MENLFGETLQIGDDIVNTNVYLKHKKYICIYTSKLNCPGCVDFTEKLNILYNKIKEIDNDILEIVLLSFDINENLYNINYKKMDFAAVPYNNYIQIDRMKKMFKIRQMPLVIVLNNNGEMLNINGNELFINNINNVQDLINKLDTN
jgi:nucleoredoxin